MRPAPDPGIRIPSSQPSGGVETVAPGKPLERNQANLALYETASRLATELGVTLGETTVGGGSDGNFTSALGIPTLDGMGAVGDGAHTPDEYFLASRIADRVALLARLAQTL